MEAATPRPPTEKKPAKQQPVFFRLPLKGGVTRCFGFGVGFGGSVIARPYGQVSTCPFNTLVGRGYEQWAIEKLSRAIPSAKRSDLLLPPGGGVKSGAVCRIW